LHIPPKKCTKGILKLRTTFCSAFCPLSLVLRGFQIVYLLRLAT
jgi:hypothetical protein